MEHPAFDGWNIRPFDERKRIGTKRALSIFL